MRGYTLAVEPKCRFARLDADREPLSQITSFRNTCGCSARSLASLSEDLQHYINRALVLLSYMTALRPGGRSRNGETVTPPQSGNPAYIGAASHS
jgi:hypothetical protein